MTINAVILAAGSGRRMRPLSLRQHKAMLPVGGSTILARIVDGIQELDVEAITVVTGYRADEVQRYLRTRCDGPNYRFVRNERYETTNNIVSLLLALDALDPGADLLLVECDLLLGRGMLARLVASGQSNVALLDRYRTGMDGTVVRVSGGFVTRVIPPSDQSDGFDYRDTYKTLNVYRFSHEFCRGTLAPLLRAHIAAGGASGYYEVVLAALGDLTPHQISAEVVEGELWAEVDDPNDLAAARFSFEPEQRASILERSRGGQWSFGMVDFAYMRNAYFPPEAMLAAMRHSLAQLVGEYGSTQGVLNEKLAWFLECDQQRVQALNGASQAFPSLRRLWAERMVAVPAPTFGEYARAFPNATTYLDAPGIDLGELERLAAAGGVLVLVNPNNPTGTTLPSTHLHTLAACHPATTFLIDESFIGFSDEGSMLRMLEAAPLSNVIVLCSLSKVLGVPGLRIGYLYSHDRVLLETLGAEIPIWNMGSVAEYFIELLLKFRPELQASLDQTKLDRDVLRQALRVLPLVLDVSPSGGNFLLVRLDGPATMAGAVCSALLKDAAINVKDVTDKFADGSPRLRVAVRCPGENAPFVDALGSLLASLAPARVN